MRFTPNTVLDAPSFLNPAHQRTISLRGHKAPMVENFTVLRDVYEVIDLTDNDLRILGNLPVLNRLKTLLVAKNRIQSIQDDFHTTVPFLESLSLVWNKISNFDSLAPLINCKKLTSLYVGNNPITQLEHYRLRLIWLLPQLKVLDFHRVKQSERAKAFELFGESPKKLDESLVFNTQAVDVDDDRDVEQVQNILKKLTDEDRAKLKEELKTATSLKEIDRIENALKNGYI